MPEPRTPVIQPEQGTVQERRLHRKQRLAAAFRLFARAGFDEGVAGHITARDPEDPERFWVNPFGMHFAHIRVSDLIQVDASGAVVEGKARVNRAAFAIHSRIHAARKDVIAVAHSHSMYGRTLSALGRKLDPLTQDACAFYGDHGLFDDYTGVVLETSEGDRIAEALGSHKALILRNHGLLTVGGSVEAAVYWFLSMDRCCQTQLMAEAAGEPVLIEPDNAKKTYGQVGTDAVGFLSFQPLYAKVVDDEPDLLE